MISSELQALIDEARADFQREIARVRREIDRENAAVQRELEIMRIELRVLSRACGARPREAERRAPEPMPSTTLH